MNKGHDKGHKGQMSDKEAMKLALEALENVPIEYDFHGNPMDVEFGKQLDAAIAALRQALEQPEQVNVPEGWKLVPIEPTDAMLSVPVNIDLRECVTPGGVTGLDAVGLFRAWEAMIEAAPQPWDASDMAHRPCGLSMEQEPVSWIPCVKLPVVVHVRRQKDGETHVSTREGITPVKPDDLIMRGVSGEEYPIGREIFERTYTFDTTPPKREWVWLTDEEILVCGGMDGADNWVFQFANALQIKLREKNHG